MPFLAIFGIIGLWLLLILLLGQHRDPAPPSPDEPPLAVSEPD